MTKKLLIFLSVFLFLIPVFFYKAPTVKAQTTPSNSTWYNQDYKDWFLKVYDDTNPTEIFGERYTAAQVQWILYSFAAMPFTKAKDIMQCAFSQNGAECADAIGKLITSVKNSNFYAQRQDPIDPWKEIFISERPFSGISYIRNKINSFSITPTVNAQTEGFGYGALEPVQGLWRGFRDASYILFVLIIIVYAFMIMFRMKLSPQSVITIQSALPKLILTILVVTFSYAIAGFMVDFLYVILGFISAAMSGISGFNFVFIPLYNFFIGAGGSLGLIFALMVYLMLFLVSLILNYVALVLSNIVFLPLGILTPILIFVVILLAVFIFFYALYKTIKISLALLKTVANIFISVVFAPFILTFSALGIGGNGIGSWIKGLFGSLLAFPVAGILIILAFFFLGLSFKYALLEGLTNNLLMDLWSLVAGWIGIDTSSTILAATPWSPPLVGEGWTGLIFLFTSFTCISLVPKAVDVAKGLMEGKQINYGSAVGEALAPIRAPFGWGASALETAAKTASSKATTTSGAIAAQATYGIPAAILRKLQGK